MKSRPAAGGRKKQKSMSGANDQADGQGGMDGEESEE
jgi:hypothetical protein